MLLFFFLPTPSLPPPPPPDTRQKKKDIDRWKAARGKDGIVYHQQGLEIIYTLNHTTWGHSGVRREAEWGCRVQPPLGDLSAMQIVPSLCQLFQPPDNQLLSVFPADLTGFVILIACFWGHLLPEHILGSFPSDQYQNHYQYPNLSPVSKKGKLRRKYFLLCASCLKHGCHLL
jgi:hypothetical protein